MANVGFVIDVVDGSGDVEGGHRDLEVMAGGKGISQLLTMIHELDVELGRSVR